jgi:hypothetical protein
MLQSKKKNHTGLEKVGNTNHTTEIKEIKKFTLSCIIQEDILLLLQHSIIIDDSARYPPAQKLSSPLHHVVAAEQIV